MNLKKVLTSLALLTVLILPVGTAMAYDPFSEVCSDPNNANSSVCNSNYNNDPVSGNNGLILRIATFISVIAGVTAIIVIIIGGISLATSGGDPQKAASARKTIIGALIGLFIIAAAQTIVYLVISNLG